MLKYDLAIIGSGPGGYVAAIRAAQLKMKTVIIERDRLGGVCLNWGCIPTKALLKSAELFDEIAHAKAFGIKVASAEADFAAIIKRSRQVADMNSKGVDFLMRKNKVDVLYGTATFENASTLKVTDGEGKVQNISASNIVIATGGRPRSIPGVSIDEERIISSKTAMTLEQQPKSLAIIGAGAIGVEFAYFYATLGTKVTLIEMMEHILPLEDAEISAVVARNFKRKKIVMHTSAMVTEVKVNKDQAEVHLKKDDQEEIITAEKVLMAVGVQGNADGLNLQNAGIQAERGFIKVDEYYRTPVDGIYAIGDITGPPLLAHVASHEGIVCVEKIAGLNPHPIDYQSVPACTYCQPQVASIGLTEKQAREQGYELKIGRFPYTASGKARAIGARDGLVKLIFDAKYNELLGAHIVGNEATELIGELGIAKTLEATPEALFQTIHAHPTLSEMIMEAGGDALGRAVHI